ncbi:MAG: prepilin-type N-terminal cleavage/methylation domain-containing protein [Lysinibacillus sp.]
MFKKLLNKKLLKNEKGLTLIELLAVIVILAIIAAIAIPAITGIIQKQEDKAQLGDASRIINSAKLAASDGACTNSTTPGAVDCTGANIKEYLEGVTFADADTVNKTAAGVWSITWTSSTYTYKKIKDGAVDPATKKLKAGATEAEVQASMGKK